MHTMKKAHEIHSGWFKYREEFAIAVTQLKELPVLISLHNWHKEVLTKEERWAALKSVVFVLWPVRMHIVPQKLTNRKKKLFYLWNFTYRSTLYYVFFQQNDLFVVEING